MSYQPIPPLFAPVGHPDQSQGGVAPQQGGYPPSPGANQYPGANPYLDNVPGQLRQQLPPMPPMPTSFGAYPPGAPGLPPMPTAFAGHQNVPVAMPVAGNTAGFPFAPYAPAPVAVPGGAQGSLKLNAQLLTQYGIEHRKKGTVLVHNGFGWVPVQPAQLSALISNGFVERLHQRGIATLHLPIVNEKEATQTVAETNAARQATKEKAESWDVAKRIAGIVKGLFVFGAGVTAAWYFVASVLSEAAFAAAMTFGMGIPFFAAATFLVFMIVFSLYQGTGSDNKFNFGSFLAQLSGWKYASAAWNKLKEAEQRLDFSVTAMDERLSLAMDEQKIKMIRQQLNNFQTKTIPEYQQLLLDIQELDTMSANFAACRNANTRFAVVSEDWKKPKK